MLAYLDFSVSTTGMLTGVKVKRSHSAGEMPGHSEQTFPVEVSRLHQRPVGGGSSVLAIPKKVISKDLHCEVLWQSTHATDSKSSR